MIGWQNVIGFVELGTIFDAQQRSNSHLNGARVTLNAVKIVCGSGEFRFPEV